jgi:hypothetical protein
MNREEELSFALSVLERHIKIHEEWAEYFEKYPEYETDYVATGEWDDAKTQRQIAAKYKRIVSFLQSLKEVN